MAYVRYKLPEESHQMLKKVCKRLGMKESEISRIAIMQYLKDIGVISNRVHKHRIIGKLNHREKESNNERLLTELMEKSHR